MSGISEGRVRVIGELQGRLVGFRNPGQPGSPIRSDGRFKLLDAVVERDGVGTSVSGTVMVGSKPVFLPGINLVDLEINENWKLRDLRASNILSFDAENCMPRIIDLPDIHSTMLFSDGFESISRPSYREEKDIWRNRDLWPSNILNMIPEKPADPSNILLGLMPKDDIQVDILSCFNGPTDPISLALRFIDFIAEK